MAPIGKALQGAETFLADETFEATGSPALAALAATGPTVLLEALGFAVSKGMIKGATKTKQLLKDRNLRKTIVDAAPDIDQIKDASRAVYKEIDESGVTLQPKATSKLINDIDSSLVQAKFKPKFAGREVNNVIEGLREEAGKALSLSDVDNLRQSVQGVLAGTASPNDKRIISTIVDTMDQFLDEAGPVKFTKGKISPSEIAPKYRIARELWGRARRSELINESFERAGRAASGFENGLVQEFRRILNNKKQIRFFKPEEKAAMQRVVTSTTPGNIAKVVGRFGFSEGHASNVLGGSAGLLLGGPGLAIAGQISRKLSQKLTQRGAKFADAVVRAGDDAKKIATIYLTQTPKAQRSVNELTELFLRQNTNVDELLTSSNTFMKEAAETTKGTKVLNAVSAAGETVKKKASEQRGSFSLEPKLTEKAKKQFGTTNDLDEAGFILEDGSLLDFSGKAQGKRTIPHDDVGRIMGAIGTTAFQRATNAVRITGPGLVSIRGLPTIRQKKKILESWQNQGDRNATLLIDFLDPDRQSVVLTRQIKRPTVDKIDEFAKEAINKLSKEE